jgi:geranylgeranyl diphosphate synthase type I
MGSVQLAASLVGKHQPGVHSQLQFDSIIDSTRLARYSSRVANETLPRPGARLSASAAGAAGIADAVDEVLSSFLQRETAALVTMDPALAQLARVAKDAVLSGGKRLRPTFAFWGWRAVAGPDSEQSEEVLPALAALELLHAFALVHDDIMDRSLTRRNQPTAHLSLASDHLAQGLRGESSHFGLSAAILTGDLCLVWADQLMATSGLPASTMMRARRGYDRMRVETIAGQFLDVLGESARQWSVVQALRTAQLKTAAYTVTRPLQFGAALAGPADPALISCFERYGQAVGIAFQLRDDLLGLHGEPSVTGKPVGEDIAAGRPTVLFELARDLATPAQASRIASALSRPEIDASELVKVITETGAVDRLEHMITSNLALAHEALFDAPLDACSREALAHLAASAAWRNS